MARKNYSEEEKAAYKEKKKADLEEMYTAIEKGVQEVFQSDKYIDYLNFYSQFVGYSPNNTILIMSQRPDAKLVASFNKWKELGRTVNKGEKGIAIFAPVYVSKREEAYQQAKDEYGNLIYNADGTEKMEKVIVENPNEKSLRFKKVYVFDVSQTSGDPLPELTKPLEGEIDPEYVQTVLVGIDKATGIKHELGPTREGVYGYCDYNNNRIVISEGLSDTQRIKTCIHEAAHSLLHSRDGDQNNRPKEEREIQAESVAYIISKRLGLNTDDYSFPYIATWASGKNISELKDILRETQKATTIIYKSIDSEIKSMETNYAAKENTYPELTNKEKAFLKSDLAPFMTKSILAWDEIEEIGYRMFESGYIDRYAPHDTSIYGNGLHETDLYDMIRRMHGGEDIRKDLTLALFNNQNSFITSKGNEFAVEYGEKAVTARYGNAERQISYEDLGNAFLSLIENEYNNIVPDKRKSLFSIEQNGELREYLNNNLTLFELLLTAATSEKPYASLMKCGDMINSWTFAEIQQSENFSFSAKMNFDENILRIYRVDGNIPDPDRNHNNSSIVEYDFAMVRNLVNKICDETSDSVIREQLLNERLDSCVTSEYKQDIENSENPAKEPTEEEVLFGQADLAKFLAERTLSSDEWEDMAHPLFENGYMEKHKPSDKSAFGYHLSEPAFYDLAKRYHNGEDIRRELALALMQHKKSDNIDFVFEDGKITDRTYYYAENLRHSLHIERTEDGFQCSFGGMERFVSFEEIGQAFLDRTYEEFDDLMYWRVLDYIRDDIPDISDETVQQLMTAFDGAALHGWDNGDNQPKINRIKKALYDILDDEEQTEKAFACIAKQKYHVSFESENPVKQPDSLTFRFGRDDKDKWISESDLARDFAMAHPDCSFALGNAIFDYLDEKQHSERNIEELHAGWYKKTDFQIHAVINGEEFNYDGRFDIGNGKGTGGGSLIDHIRDHAQGIIEYPQYPYNTPESKERAQHTLDVFIPFLEAHSELTLEEQQILDDFKEQHPIRTYDDIEQKKSTPMVDAPEVKKVHQVITNAGFNGGIDDRMEYATVDEAVKAGRDYLADGYLGFSVYNQETKKIEHIEGDFPLYEAFNPDILRINGMHDLADEVQARMDEMDRERYANPTLLNDVIHKFFKTDCETAETTDARWKIAVGEGDVVGKVFEYGRPFCDIHNTNDKFVIETFFARDAELSEMVYEAMLSCHLGNPIVKSVPEPDTMDLGTVTMRKVGDFYEMYGKNAEIGAEILGLHMLSKHGEPMVGFPDHIKDEYSKKLDEAGYIVLIEQEQHPIRTYDDIEKVQSKFQIYQLPGGDEYRGIRFEGRQQLEKDGVSLNHDDYELVYEGLVGEFHGKATLEAIYTQFNTDRPADFTGHSLSVSDVVVIEAEGKQTAYYCDTAGFVEMPEFFLKKEKAQEKSTPEHSNETPTPKNLSQLKKALKEGMEFEITAHFRPESVGEHRRITSVNTVGFTSKKLDENGVPYGNDIHMEWYKAGNWKFSDNEVSCILNNSELLMSFHVLDGTERAKEADSVLVQAEKPETEKATPEKQQLPDLHNVIGVDKIRIDNDYAFVWTYFNPDGYDEKGQFVDMFVSEQDLKYALRAKAKAEKESEGDIAVGNKAFIESIYSTAYTELTDNDDSQGFKLYTDDFINGKYDFIANSGSKTFAQDKFNAAVIHFFEENNDYFAELMRKNRLNGYKPITTETAVAMWENGFSVTDKNGNEFAAYDHNDYDSNDYSVFTDVEDYTFYADVNDFYKQQLFDEISDCIDSISCYPDFDLHDYHEDYEWYSYKDTQNAYLNVQDALRRNEIEPIENYLFDVNKQSFGYDNLEDVYNLCEQAQNAIKELKQENKRELSRTQNSGQGKVPLDCVKKNGGRK